MQTLPMELWGTESRFSPEKKWKFSKEIVFCLQMWDMNVIIACKIGGYYDF